MSDGAHETLPTNVVDELQTAVRNVLGRAGYYPTSDAVIVVESLAPNGGTTLTHCTGRLLPWTILGRLEYAAELVRSRVPRT